MSLKWEYKLMPETFLHKFNEYCKNLNLEQRRAATHFCLGACATFIADEQTETIMKLLKKFMEATYNDIRETD